MSRGKKLLPANPTPDPTSPLYAKLAEWEAAKKEVAEAQPAIAREMALRKEVFALAFPSPAEGTNAMDLNAGWQLKGVYKLERKLDEAMLPYVFEELRKQGVVPDPLVRRPPELAVSLYKALSPGQRAILDEAITTKPASPTLELVPPPEPKEPK